MDALALDDIFLFEDFRLHRRDGALFRRAENGHFVPVAIGSRALEVLGVLVERPGDLVWRGQIITTVWPATVVEDNNLNIQIAALRRVLDARRPGPSYIQTIPGRGYRLVVAVTRRRANVVGSAQSSAPRRLSIVVLPFANLSNDPEQQYFADAITEDLTADLSRLGDMLVISRNTAFTYRNKAADTKQIGRELGVRYVLEGSIQRSGNRARVNAQLIDAETDAHLWADRFAGDTGDLFALQDEITSRIAVKLRLELVGAEAARPTEHPDALDYIFRARAILARDPTPDAYAKAIGLYDRALVLDPLSVEAQCRLAIALAGRVLDQMTDTEATDIARAEGLVGNVLTASSRSPLARLAKGSLLRAQDRFEEAIPEYEMALAADRNMVRALADTGRCKLYMGLMDEAIALIEQAIRLSPRDPQTGNWYHRIGQAHLLQSHTDEAIVWFEKARRASPALPYVHSYLAAAYALKGDNDHAATELAEARRLSGGDRLLSIARTKAIGVGRAPKISALVESTYFAGLRRAGMLEE
jgi:TolB-like protein